MKPFHTPEHRCQLWPLLDMIQPFALSPSHSLPVHAASGSVLSRENAQAKGMEGPGPLQTVK